MNLRTLQSVDERRKAIEAELSVDLCGVGSSVLDTSKSSSKNCENMVGYTQIPMGIAGPITIKSENGKINNYYLPLTTTEGALVASISRGCKAITESGGAIATAFRIGTTRGAVFSVNNVMQGKEVAEYIYAHKTAFETIASETSTHIWLTDIVVKSVGKYVFVRFAYNTQDAMGMNMVTIATDVIARAITNATNARCLSVAGNYDIDKKPAWLNVIQGRGFEVRADVVIPSTVLEQTLKTTAKNLYDVWLAKCMIGSALAGSLGFNAQFANIIAAMFLATGQDPAHITEGSLGITTCEVVDDSSLYMSVYLPDLMVGTVGGGTGLQTQTEALSILGVETSQQLAEVISGAVLAGELSLLASLSEGSLIRAHKRLGRGESV